MEQSISALIILAVYAGLAFLVIYWAVRLAIRHEDRRKHREPSAHGTAGGPAAKAAGADDGMRRWVLAGLDVALAVEEDIGTCDRRAPRRPAQIATAANS